MFRNALLLALLVACTAFASITVYKAIEKRRPANSFLRCYSQEGEDMLIRRLIGKKKEGFFVDIGAYHPMKLSNTYHFYRRGWRGINIDARPGSMQLFQKYRPKDINLEVAIGKEIGNVDFYLFDEPAFNTCERCQEGYTSVVKVPMKPLSLVLDEHLSPGQAIDFFTIDVEGLDLEVLKSNNWTRYRPQFILVESLSTEAMQDALLTPTAQFLQTVDYLLVAKTKNTLCFKCKTQ